MERHAKVRDLMSDQVRTLRSNDKVSIADKLMQMERIRHLPVLDDEDLLIGVVSQRDLFRSALARTLGYGTAAQDKVMDMLVVKEVMSTDIKTIGPEAPIEEAAAILIEHKIGCLPVVERNLLVGMLTESDFVKWVADSRR